MPAEPHPVPEASLDADAMGLAELEPRFGALLQRNGSPPAWRRPASYGTIVRLVLEQQVSLASATAAYERLETRVGIVTPEAVLASTPDQLRGDGFSRQKDRYVRGIARDILDGTFVVPGPGDDPTEARERLLARTGVGPWTAACYLLFVLGAPDVWPRGDRALHVSMAGVFGWDEVPDSDAAAAHAEAWSPYRSTAARMLWHEYLGGPAYHPTPASGFL